MELEIRTLIHRNAGKVAILGLGASEHVFEDCEERVIRNKGCYRSTGLICLKPGRYRFVARYRIENPRNSPNLAEIMIADWEIPTVFRGVNIPGRADGLADSASRLTQMDMRIDVPTDLEFRVTLLDDGEIAVNEMRISEIGEVVPDDQVDVFPLIDRVSFELSNRCSYSHLHKMCPASLGKEPVVLPSKIIFDVLDTLGKRKFDGGIAFHNYNEPMSDPRLFKLVEYARCICPACKILIWTNGWNLNQVMMNELIASGVTTVYATAYTKEEKHRLDQISASIEYNVIEPEWVEVMDAYEMPPINDTRPCLAPLTDLRISKEGFIVLCCRDWRNEYKFFDLNDRCFEEALREKSLLDTYRRLKEGDRFYPLCKRCGTARDWTRFRPPL